MSEAVIALGTNLGNRIDNLNKAMKSISLLPGVKIKAGSGVYETDPVGLTNQCRFYNAVLLVETDTSPAVLLGECLGIEAAMGRVRKEKNGPRIIDLDLLLYENYRNESFELTVPHPAITERPFVMKPLSDIFPSGRALGLNFGRFLRELGEEGVDRTEYELIIPEEPEPEGDLQE